MATVAHDEPVERCAAVGARIGLGSAVGAAGDGDGSACRGTKAPGYDDPRAEAYDEGVARALADADPDALLGLDPGFSAELKVAGRAPWQVLAGAVREAGGDWRGELQLPPGRPYGVFLPSWRTGRAA